MSLDFSNDRFMHVCLLNKRGQKVYPHLAGMRGTNEKGLKLALKEKKNYKIFTIDEFINLLVNGKFNGGATVKMAPLGKIEQTNGFTLNKDITYNLHEVRQDRLYISNELKEEIEYRKNLKREISH